MPHHRRPTRPAAVALALAIALGGCGTTSPTSTPAPTTPATAQSPGPTASARPAAEVYAEIRAQVEQIRGLMPTAAVDPVSIDETQLRKNLQGEFDASYTPSSLKAAEDELIALGLLPPGSSLRTLTLDLEAGQVAGYYSPEKDELFVVSRSGGLGAAEMVTYAHEFTHQLQDQDLGLNKLGLDAHDQSDRSLARLALVEGDAVSVQSAWTTANLTSQQLGELLGASLDPKALEALQRAPAFLRDTALFPYSDGVSFVGLLITKGGYAAVNAAFHDPPDSTEQILHPDKYADRERPVDVALPKGLAASLGAGWSEAGRDTLGELVIRIWLRAGGATAAVARAATAGWGGDRLALFRGPDGKVAVALRTEWDSAADADEFLDAAIHASLSLQLGASLEHEPGSRVVTMAVGEDSTMLVAAIGK
jgi:hypothetical protein